MLLQRDQCFAEQTYTHKLQLNTTYSYSYFELEVGVCMQTGSLLSLLTLQPLQIQFQIQIPDTISYMTWHMKQ